MLRRYLFYTGVLLLSLLVPAAQPDSSQSKAEQIEGFLNLCHEYRLFNGVALVAQENNIIYKNAFGIANREWDVPHEKDSKFLLGSVSKQFTALLILQLAQEGRLKLDDCILKYLPDYPPEKGRKITLHHLLCHSSGIPTSHDLPNWYSELWRQDYTSEELPRLFYDLELRFEPGTGFHYSNPGYYMLAVVIEKVTGKPYEDVMNERVFVPLEMRNSGVYDLNSLVSKMSSPYEYWNFAFTRSDYWNPTSTRGAGGIYSTVDDLFKWERALASHALLTPEYQKMMFAPHTPIRGSDAYAYGWVVREIQLEGSVRPVLIALHTGAHPGFNTLVLRIPRDGYFIALCHNSGQTDLNALQTGLLNILYGRRVDIKQPVSLALAACESLDDMNRVMAEFRISPDQFRIRRDAVNGLGFKLLRENMTAEGLALLEFNSQQFPRSHWVYESLGAAYLMAGNKNQAVKYMQKTLELDPDNDFALKKLKELQIK
jgi:CubicO group peptidase (beta-lactamase class C family)